MARPLRIALPDGTYHVMSRGNAKMTIYLDDHDRKEFLGIVATTIERYSVRCHAYCLMPNHYHLLLETPKANISAAVKYLNGVYALRWNQRHKRVGHVFQGRFKAQL